MLDVVKDLNGCCRASSDVPQLNDVLSLCVGLWAVKVANQQTSSKMYTYGVSPAALSFPPWTCSDSIVAECSGNALRHLVR